MITVKIPAKTIETFDSIGWQHDCNYRPYPPSPQTYYHTTNVPARDYAFTTFQKARAELTDDEYALVRMQVLEARKRNQLRH